MGRTFAEYVTERIGEAIFRSGLSIRQAGSASGINHMTLHRSLAGERVFNLDDVARIASALGLTPAELMNAEGFEPV
ncbi:helix-turn-helix transcriptional regulator [Aeromicrobium sp.]|uniref:helix-turn-helix transcriptional regulator n=1 Tax=Aeromicrobium sp. TaxID=1871063 RepID=UPI002FC878AA